MPLVSSFSPPQHPVGGGSAGCLLANRLSANPLVSVLLLEAGGLEDAGTRVPLFALLQFHDRYDWNYFTEPQTHSCMALNEQVGQQLV